MLEECRILFHDISLHHDFSIHWQWRIDPSGGYSVQGLYQLLTTQELHNHDVPTNLIWHQQVPLNVSIFAWRLIWNSLSSKDNLVECDIISLETQHCVSGCGSIKTAQHLFLSCPCFGSLWGLVRAWLNISAADPFHLQDHFIQFAYSSGGSRVRRDFMQLV